MNLQVCAPYEPCVYNCPFCIARTHPEHNHEFKNLFDGSEGTYLWKLDKCFFEHDIDCVVITGECDPTQNLRWANIVIDHIKRQRPEVRIEFQTHNLSINEHTCPKGIDVLAYSITNMREYLTSWRCYKPEGVTTRAVIIVTSDFSWANKDNFCSMGFDQITFKTLNPTENDNINKWISAHNLNNIDNFYDIMNSRNGSSVSFRVDTTCQQAEGRYFVFRSDGKTYLNWETATPL